MAKGCGDWRKTSCDKFKDKWYRDLSSDAVKLLEYMRSNCYDSGIIEHDKEEWEYATKLSIDRQEQALAEIMATGKFERGIDGDNTYYCEKGFIEYQQDAWKEIDGVRYYKIMGGKFRKIEKEILRFEKIFSFLAKRWQNSEVLSKGKQDATLSIAPRYPLHSGADKRDGRIDCISSSGESKGETSSLGRAGDYAWDEFDEMAKVCRERGISKVPTDDGWVMFCKRYPDRNWGNLCKRLLEAVYNEERVTSVSGLLNVMAQKEPSDAGQVGKAQKAVDKQFDYDPAVLAAEVAAEFMGKGAK